MPHCLLRYQPKLTDMHAGDYVDNVRWFGDCVMSKSTKNRIVMWQPDSLRHEGAHMILREFSLTHGEMWFFKMDVCVPLNIFAVGNTRGKVRLFAVELCTTVVFTAVLLAGVGVLFDQDGGGARQGRKLQAGSKGRKEGGV